MTACVVCGADTVRMFLDLGQTALANKFLRREELTVDEPRFPLRVGFCESCEHVQLTEIVPPSAMFEDYLYVSAASDTLRQHLFGLSEAIVARYPVSADGLIIDIGCNDGTLLQGFARFGARTLGVDPARNLAALTAEQGMDRLVAFFTAATARQIVETRGRASIVTATNTFPHIPDLYDFARGITEVLAPGGVFVIEAHYLLDMLEQAAFDTIYHEHVSYWALGPMLRLLDEHNLEVVHVERLPIHHGQLRVFVQRKAEGEVQPSVAATLDGERQAGIGRFETFLRFAETAQRIKTDLRQTLDQIHASGKRVAGYGAPAKGNTLLEFLGLGPESVTYIADRSPLKQGRFTPGSHIPVVSPERLLDDQPDYVIILAWNFAEEIIEQLRPYRERGGTFILPVPDVRLI